MNKKRICFVLCIAVLLSLFASCSHLPTSNQDKSEDTESSAYLTEGDSSFADVTEIMGSASLVVCDDQDSQTQLSEESIVWIQSGVAVDIDNDGKQDTISFQSDENEKYTITVNEAEFEETEFMYLSNCGVAQISNGIYDYNVIVVKAAINSECGCYVFYLYEDGEIIRIGSFESDSTTEEVYITPDGTISIPSYMRCGLNSFRVFTFTVAQRAVDDFSQSTASDRYALALVPVGTYPIGMIVSATVTVPVQISPCDESVIWTIEPGETIILSATDDSTVMYIESLDRTKCGWIKLSDYSGDNSLYDVFNGVWMGG